MRIIIAGDFCPQYRVSDRFKRGDYAYVLGEVRSFFEKADYSILNLECPICNGAEKPIDKFGPNLKCQEIEGKSLVWLGVNCVTLANNHFLDYGDEGVEHTLSYCLENGIDCIGGGLNLDSASQTLYKEIGGHKIAIINCCEHEFSIATESSAGCNPLNPIKQYYAIIEARKKAEYVIIIIHGGHEYFQLPSLRMQEAYRFFIDAGADVVVNHHQHCYSGFEIYKGKPIFYGLGNFCFDEEGSVNSTWNEGYFVELTIDENQLGYEIYPYKQCSEEAKILLLGKNDIKDKLEELNQVICDKQKLEQAINKYYKETSLSYGDIFEISNNRYFLGCVHRNWLPSSISKRKRLIATNFICCESHRDKLIYFLKEK